MKYLLGFLLLFITTLLVANSEIVVKENIVKQETAKTIAFQEELKSKKSRQQILRDEVKKLRELMLKEQNQS